MVDPDAPIPYQLTDLARHELAQWRKTEDMTDCPRHDWERDRRYGLMCQNCGLVADDRDSSAAYAPHKERSYRKW